MTSGSPKTGTISRPLFQREDRDIVKYRVAITIARALSLFFCLIPSPIRNYVAERLGSLSYRLSHGYRQNVESNLQVVTRRDVIDAEIRDLTRSIFINNGLNFMDLLVLPRKSTGYFGRRADLVEGSWEIVEKAMLKGKGVILVSAHVGCFDFLGHYIASSGIPLTVMTGRTTSRFLFDGVTYLRSTRGADMVEPTPSGVRQVIKALRRGEIAVFVADRDFFQNGVEADFFGRITTLPPGAVRISRDTGAPIVPLFTRRTRRGHQVRIYPEISIQKSDDVDGDVRRGMERLVPILEDGIASGIEQWVMFQRVWPVSPVDAIRIFPEGSPLESELLERMVQRLPERKSASDSDTTTERLPDLRSASDSW